MGNSSSKDERGKAKPNALRHGGGGPVASPEPSPTPEQSSAYRMASRTYAQRNHGNGRGNRPDLSFLHMGRAVERDGESGAPDRPRETKQEREARRAERERQARLKERERSMREEHVDGGYLVTLGVYTGVEDFSKPVVRQLQIERRLAPFWRGLNDHSTSWTEAQLVAAARGLAIPAPDAVPPELDHPDSQAYLDSRSFGANVDSLTIPINSRSQSYQSDRSATLSASHPAFSTNSGPSSPTTLASSNPLFRGRAKTLASTLTGKSQSPDLTPREIRLRDDPFVNGQRLEAVLYKDASECPICFMYYPPYLNKTRCCDQPICSECFVQIKRPDPHPPEHEQPGEARPPEEEAEMLVSEVAACPFCVTPEFGVTYEPPPFRKGLAYAHQQHNPLKNPTSAMSSSTSLASGAGRRRATSLSANSSQVITTDRVRPDWAKKLADARAHALRRSAAATALHNAAYVLGNHGDGQLRGGGLMLGRRRRTLFGDSPNASGSGTPGEGMAPAEYDAFFRPANRARQGEGNGDLVSGRSSSRRHRVEDLEELMMMEAIRLSLAAEEDRKRKEEKEAAKEAKKRAKADKKEEKKAAKESKKNGGGGGGSLYHAGPNESSSTWASTGMVRSSSNLGVQNAIPEEQLQGKGKQPAQDFAGFNPLDEPTSTLNREPSPTPSGDFVTEAQRHLEESRANLQPNVPTPSPRAGHFRQLSNASSAASSFVDSPSPGSHGASNNASGIDVTAGAQQDGTSNVSSNAGTPAATTGGVEPMFNFRSLAAMIGEEDKNLASDEHIEHAEPVSKAEEELKEPSPSGSPRGAPATLSPADGNRSRGDSGESSSSAPPPIYVEHAQNGGEGDDINAAPQPQQRLVHNPDKKQYGEVNVAESGHDGVHDTAR